MTKRMLHFVKETAALRREIAQADDFGEPITIEFTGRELAGLTYALALAYISEWVNGENGARKIQAMISDASAAVLYVAETEGKNMDEFLNELLGEKTNPEDEGDGA